MTALAGFGEKEKTEKIVDVEELELKCQGCDKLLLTLAVSKIGDIETKFRAICGFCGDHSPIATLKGKPYISYPEGLTFTNQDFSTDVVLITVGKM